MEFIISVYAFSSILLIVLFLLFDYINRVRLQARIATLYRTINFLQDLAREVTVYDEDYSEIIELIDSAIDCHDDLIDHEETYHN